MDSFPGDLDLSDLNLNDIWMNEGFNSGLEFQSVDIEDDPSNIFNQNVTNYFNYDDVTTPWISEEDYEEFNLKSEESIFTELEVKRSNSVDEVINQVSNSSFVPKVLKSGESYEPLRSEDNRRRHRKWKEIRSPTLCHICGIILSSPRGLRTHINVVHLNRKKKKPGAAKTKIAPPTSNLELERNLNPNSGEDHETLRKEDNRPHHRKSKEIRSPQKCHICGIILCSRRGLRAHINQVHLNRKKNKRNEVKMEPQALNLEMETIADTNSMESSHYPYAVGAEITCTDSICREIPVTSNPIVLRDDSNVAMSRDDGVGLVPDPSASTSTFKCDTCGTSYSYMKGLTRHIDTRHRGIPRGKRKGLGTSGRICSSDESGQSVLDCNGAEIRATVTYNFTGLSSHLVVKVRPNGSTFLAPTDMVSEAINVGSNTNTGKEALDGKQHAEKKTLLPEKVQTGEKTVIGQMNGTSETQTRDKIQSIDKTETNGKSETGIKTFNAGETKVNGEMCNKCPLCPSTYDSPKSLSDHIIVVHSSKRTATYMKCTKCRESFESPQLFQQHLRTHEPDLYAKRQRLPCHLCGGRFDRKYIKLHIQTHSTERPYNCEPCGRSFTLKIYLRDHQKRWSHYTPNPENALVI